MALLRLLSGFSACCDQKSEANAERKRSAPGASTATGAARAETRRRALQLVLEPAQFQAVPPESDPILLILHERPLFAAVRLEVLRVLLSEDLTEERDPEQVAIVERDPPLTDT